MLRLGTSSRDWRVMLKRPVAQAMGNAIHGTDPRLAILSKLET